MDLSKLALKNAISIEVKKDGLQQKQSGDWMLRFTVAAIEMDRRITTAPMGTRFACALVEIDDDESPVDHVEEDRDKWRDLGPVTQSALRCQDRIFWAFLKEELHFDNITNEERAADVVRSICGVGSRSDFGKPGFSHAREAWYKLDNSYQAWKARERA